MTVEEKKEKIKELLANENRQPSDDQELEALQKEVSNSAPVAGSTPSEPSAPVNENSSMSELKRVASQTGIKYKVGMSKAKLFDAIKKALGK